MDRYDVCNVWAEAVGCAIARELAHRLRDTPLRIIVLEQHKPAGTETSGRHSGPHEEPFSLKSRIARESSALAVSYASLQGLPLLNTGMVVAVA